MGVQEVDSEVGDRQEEDEKEGEDNTDIRWSAVCCCRLRTADGKRVLRQINQHLVHRQQPKERKKEGKLTIQMAIPPPEIINKSLRPALSMVR